MAFCKAHSHALFLSTSLRLGSPVQHRNPSKLHRQRVANGKANAAAAGHVQLVSDKLKLSGKHVKKIEKKQRRAEREKKEKGEKDSGATVAEPVSVTFDAPAAAAPAAATSAAAAAAPAAEAAAAAAPASAASASSNGKKKKKAPAAAGAKQSAGAASEGAESMQVDDVMASKPRIGALRKSAGGKPAGAAAAKKTAKAKAAMSDD